MSGNIKLLEEQYDEQSKVLAEAITLIYSVGMLDNLSPKTRDFLAENEHLQKAIMDAEKPSLEPRLTMEEYIKHIVHILEVPHSQHEFTSFIVQVCYIMMLAEKNPLIAQELKGVLGVNSMLKDIVKRK